MTDPLGSIVILGGGSAGWMTAAALSQTIGTSARITLIESEAIGTVGVGEATIPPVRRFNAQLGIDEATFLKETQGTFKLGIEFVNWSRAGHSYFHPFGPFGSDFDRVPLYQYWLSEERRAPGSAGRFDDHSMGWHLARAGKFAHPMSDRRRIQSTYDYAYHFDAGLYARFLRRFSEERGVTRWEGRIGSLSRDGQSGFVTSVTMQDGREVAGDLFVDCTGFRSLALGKELGIPYEDWSEWLPCDAAVAVPCAHGGNFTPYTRSTAQEAGWQWRIPLQHRIGNGYVYRSDMLSEDEAVSQLLSRLDGAPLGEPRRLTFKAGRRRTFWDRNVVAIGLSAGFLEPLESTSLHLIQTGITRLLALFPDKAMDPLLAEEYNRITTTEYERIRDFLILHYHATAREDTALWRHCKSMNVPDTLRYKLAHFRRDGKVVADQYDLFANPSWLAVYIGQEVIPERDDPMLGQRGRPDGAVMLGKIRGLMEEVTAAASGHREFLDRYAPAAAPADMAMA